MSLIGMTFVYSSYTNTAIITLNGARLGTIGFDSEYAMGRFQRFILALDVRPATEDPSTAGS